MSSPISEDTAVKYVISVGKENRGLICVGIQDGRSWASDMFKIEALGHAVEELEVRLGKPRRRRATPNVGERYE
jgi:hypothetical protein